MYDDERVRDAALMVVTDEFRYPTSGLDEAVVLIQFLDHSLGSPINEHDGWKLTAWTCDHCDGRHAGLVLDLSLVSTLAVRRPPPWFGEADDRRLANRFMDAMMDWFEEVNGA